MELDFPEGNIHKPMSEELQNNLFEKMKSAIWAIRVSESKSLGIGTGFCIDPHGLLLTVYHLIDSDKHVEVFARRYNDEEFIKCNVVYTIPHFDVAILELDYQNSGTSSSSHGKEEEGNINGFDYLKIDDNLSRNLSVGSEVFGIGCCKGQGFHFVRGVMTYEFEGDTTDYNQLAIDFNFVAKADWMDTAFYTSPKFSVIKGGPFCILKDGEDGFEPEMHPELPYIQISYGEMSEIGGMSGSPFLNSQGKVIGMLFSGGYNVMGVSSSALYAALKCYKDNSLYESCCPLYTES